MDPSADAPVFKSRMLPTVTYGSSRGGLDLIMHIESASLENAHNALLKELKEVGKVIGTLDAHYRTFCTFFGSDLGSLWWASASLAAVRTICELQ